MLFRPLFLSIAMVSLSLSYILFSNQQYFSMVSMVALFVPALLAAVLFIFAEKLAAHKNRQFLMAVSIGIIVAVSLYEVMFSHMSGEELSFAIYVISVVSVAVVISLLGLYLTGKAMRHAGGYYIFLVPIACLVLTSVLAYLAMYGFQTPSWSGVDELAYNYYAADLFNHGINPYTSSMEPILTQRHISPTVELDGVYEYAYDYPPLSFLAFLPLPLLGITSFFSFIWLVVLFGIFASFMVYHRSGYDEQLLIPIAAWLFFTFTIVGTTSHYLAIAIFIFLAYLERKRALLSGVLLGLAASTIQLAWFFIPFFYVLELREFGKDQFFRQVGASLLTFAAICAYFVVLSPQQTMGNIFALFGLNKLVFYGVNIMQLSYAFYPVAYWYSAFISIATFIILLAIFYLYTKSLLPMIAVVPAMIFFLSWRNITLYSLPAIPLLLAVHYTGNSARDLTHNKRYAAYALLGLAVFALMVAVYSHSSYSQQQGLKINKIVPVLYLQRAPNAAGYFSLGGFVANVSSGEPAPQNVSFYIVSRSPNLEGYALGSLLPQLQPGSSYNYSVKFQLPLVNNSTQLFIFAFSKYYVASREFNISIVPPANMTLSPPSESGQS